MLKSFVYLDPTRQIFHLFVWHNPEGVAMGLLLARGDATLSGLRVTNHVRLDPRVSKQTLGWN